ncbi:hypothetical protein Patl1_15122 [Pistacia atlantica]|uniref:Uncharacterized protein n=1 Tax=Pistacia atlantica TaxID=434234 RepID=A0ACC1B7A2_9ROSI|nr:hypothetical protein Patl1_15122 [Pistacia atlantica]
MNEIEILTQLRHRNPVSLYGYTSHHSPQGLLLVYEYMPYELLLIIFMGKEGSLTLGFPDCSPLMLHMSQLLQNDLLAMLILIDMNRHKHEINLANLAINRIHTCAIEELIDLCLRYQSDDEVKRMMTTDAELAFLCLQQNKKMRPSMEVELKRTESAECKPKNLDNNNEVLKRMQPTASSTDLG